MRGAAVERPNVVYIILDDLGMYDTGCYGSKQIQTPNIDRLAAEGMMFSEAYSGCTVCAPARSTLMTGKHMGHASVRANPGGVPMQASDFTLAQMLKTAGYACGGFGKWGLGDIDTPGVPETHGFDRFFGYYHQVHEGHFALPYRVKMQACRRGRWKIVRNDVAKPWELYDLADDPSEKSDLASARPELVKELGAWARANREDPPRQAEPDKPRGQGWR